MPRHLFSIFIPLSAIVMVACSGDTTPTDTDSGTPPVIVEGTPVVVVMGSPYMPTGATEALTVAIYNTDVTEVTWASDDDAVLTVDDTGMATAHIPGQVTVTATITVDGLDVAGSLGVFVQNEIPFYSEWRGSAHAKYDAEAFNHWNEDGEVPTTCARCHSTPGFADYIGADGSAPDSVDAPARLGTAVECVACHNAAADALEHVTFPSGVVVENLGAEARCMTCHQGRAAGADLDQAFAELGLTDPDTVSSKLGFTNIHYYPAGATLFAGQVLGGYQYAGQIYDWRFRHVEEANTCIGCHNQHSLQIRLEKCSTCHVGVTTKEDLRNIRMMASLSSDYDGDGDTTEGVYYEIEGLRAEVLATMQRYAVDQGVAPICYDADAYPYFFQDTNGNGSCDGSEAGFSNAYASWSPRSVSAAYNYQMSVKDPGNFAHNAKYTIQLLHDSLADLNEGLTAPMDLTAFIRNDPGHFNGAGEPARHWDADETISSSCSRCHGGQLGIEFYLEYGVGLQGEEPDNGLECQTCHVALPDFTVIRQVEEVTFPSGVTLEGTNDTSFVCMTCHQGRESKATVDDRIATGSLAFRNIHYLPAGATLYGAEAAVGYEYDGRDYSGLWPHNTVPGTNHCTFCHDPVVTEHTFDVFDAFDTNCVGCHGPAKSPRDIRGAFFGMRHDQDYDGDGSSTEPLVGEVAGLGVELYAAMQAVADICYESHSYPYFFNDTNRDGTCQVTEATRANSFSAWTEPLMKATFNYQFYQKDPGAYAHNFEYIGQLLFDSIEDVSGNTDGLVRPPVN